MDDQLMGQVPNQVPEPIVSQTPSPKRCNCAWCAAGSVLGVVAVLAVAFGLWYYYGMKTPAPAAPIAEESAPAVEETQIPPLTAGNTTADISADLSQLADSSAALDADAAAATDVISGL